MSEDFVTRLQVQLREAAEAETRRGAVRRAATDVRHRPGPLVVAVMLIALVAGVASLALRDRRPAPGAGEGIRVVDQRAVVGEGGTMVAGFGAGWIADATTGEVIRLRASDRRIDGHVELSDTRRLAVGFGSLWALVRDGTLVRRIDPETGAVGRPIALPTGDRALVVVPGRGAMWAVSQTQLVRIDPDTGRVERVRRLDRDGFLASGFASDAAHLYVQRADGVVLALDAATGARVATLRPRVAGEVLAAAGGTLYFATEAGGVAAVDGATGRTRWQRDLKATWIGEILPSGRDLWVQSTGSTGSHDLLRRVDATTGRLTGSLELETFGVTGMALVGGRVWLVTPRGRLVVVE